MLSANFRKKKTEVSVLSENFLRILPANFRFSARAFCQQQIDSILQREKLEDVRSRLQWDEPALRQIFSQPVNRR